MKFKRLFLFVLALLLINPFLYPSNFSGLGIFICRLGWFYYVVSNEIVEEVDKEIGHVTKYSDREGTYSGNFSNRYKKGAYFRLKLTQMKRLPFKAKGVLI